MGDAFDGTAPVLEADAFTLRGLSLDDAPAVFAYASYPEVARYTLWPPHRSEDATRGFLRMLALPWVLGWAIVPRGEHSAIGMVFLHSLDRRHRKAELAFNIARDRWNRGLATAASRLVLRHSFAGLGLNRVEATCMPANLGSVRVLAKLGMSREAGMRRSHRRHDGFHDMELFAILRDEFRA